MTCPFCGVETDVPHETQQGCIDALRSEIVRVRDILQNVRSFEVPGAPDPPEDPENLPEETEIEPLC
jgi:hypothetical protein